MAKTTRKRERKPQLAVRKELFELIKSQAQQRRDKIETVTEDLLVTACRIKRIPLPEGFESASSS